MDEGGLCRLLGKMRAERDWTSASALIWHAMEEPALQQILRPIHFNIVLASLSETREWERALMLLEQISQTGLHPDVYSFSAAISACKRASQPDEAISLFRSMCASDVRPNTVCFNTVLDACQAAGRHEQLLALFGAMAAYGVEPDAWTYSSAIGALSRTGQWQRAMEMFDRLEPLLLGRSATPRQLEQYNHCHAATMRAALRAGSWSAVLSLYDRLREAGVEPNSHTLRPAIVACAGAHAEEPEMGCQRAVRLLYSAPSVAANEHTYTAAAQACEKAGSWRVAVELLDRMEEQGVQPNAHMCTAVIGAHAGEGRWSEALTLLDKMCVENIPLDGHTTSAALRVCACAGAWEPAMQFLMYRMPVLGARPSVHHVSTVMNCCGKARRWQESLQVAKRCEEQGVVLDRGLLTTALAACGRVGEWEYALAVLRQLTRIGGTVDMGTRRNAIAAMGRGGQWELALRLTPPEADVACHNMALLALCRTGQWQHARQLLLRIRKRGPEPDELTCRLAEKVRVAIARGASDFEGR